MRDLDELLATLNAEFEIRHADTARRIEDSELTADALMGEVQAAAEAEAAEKPRLTALPPCLRRSL